MKYIDLAAAKALIRERGVLGDGYSDTERENDVCEMLEEVRGVELPCEVGDILIDAIPAADVVAVVRCYECKFWEHRPDRQYDLCAYLMGAKRSCTPEDFCSRGERKGGQDDE